jgi:hypothetical protein
MRRIVGSRFKVQGSAAFPTALNGLGYKVQGIRLRVEGVWFAPASLQRVQGFGFRFYGSQV